MATHNTVRVSNGRPERLGDLMEQGNFAGQRMARRGGQRLNPRAEEDVRMAPEVARKWRVPPGTGYAWCGHAIAPD